MAGIIDLASTGITGLLAATVAGDAVRFEQLFTSGVVTFLGNVAFNPTTAGIVGTATNNNAASGTVGEYVASVSTSNTNYPTTLQYGDLTSISLTAGDWDVSAQISAALISGVVTQIRIGISTTTGNSGTGLTEGDTLMIFPGPTATNNQGSNIETLRVSLSGTTTHYLKYYASYTVAAPIANGRISARRVR